MVIYCLCNTEWQRLGIVRFHSMICCFYFSTSQLNYRISSSRTLIEELKYRVGLGLGVYIWEEVSFYISTTWWVPLLVDKGISKGTCCQNLQSTPVDS